MIEDDVSQQGRNNPALWRADSSRFEDTVLHHARPEKFVDQTEDVAIRDFSHQCFHDARLRQIIKEGMDVRIENNVETLLVERQGLANCPMAIAVLAEA